MSRIGSFELVESKKPSKAKEVAEERGEDIVKEWHSEDYDIGLTITATEFGDYIVYFQKGGYAEPFSKGISDFQTAYDDAVDAMKNVRDYIEIGEANIELDLKEN